MMIGKNGVNMAQQLRWKNPFHGKPVLRCLGRCVGFSSATIAYIVMDNLKGPLHVYPASWPLEFNILASMWPILFGLFGALSTIAIIYENHSLAVQVSLSPSKPSFASVKSGLSHLPRWRACLFVFCQILPLCLMSNFIGCIIVGDFHPCISATFACISQLVLNHTLLRPFVAELANQSRLILTSPVFEPINSNSVHDDGRQSGTVYGALSQHEEDDLEISHLNSSVGSSIVHSSASSPSSTGLSCSCVSKNVLAFSILCVAAVIALGMAIQSPLRAHEVSAYPPPGKLYSIPIYSNASSYSLNHQMHMYCTGPINASRPTFLFESGGGSCGFSFFGIQQALANAGWHTCSYDRSGYGWSQSMPLGAGSAEATARKLMALLEAAGELRGTFILAGHSAGVEISQVFAALHPELISGAVFMDGYPDYLHLLKYTSAQIASDTTRVCAATQAARAFEAVGLTRLVTSFVGKFTPQSEASRYASTYATGRAWNAQYNDYCTSEGGYNTEGELLQSLASPDAPTFNGNGIKWPTLRPNVPVLMMPAGLTVLDGTDPTNMYWQQVLAYNATISPTNTTSIQICMGCSHGFPWEKGNWAASQMDSYFTQFF